MGGGGAGGAPLPRRLPLPRPVIQHETSPICKRQAIMKISGRDAESAGQKNCHNSSSRYPNKMIFIRLESLRNYLQLSFGPLHSDSDVTLIKNRPQQKLSSDSRQHRSSYCDSHNSQIRTDKKVILVPLERHRSLYTPSKIS